MESSNQDPRSLFPRPEFKQQSQEPHGSEAKMDPRPDFGKDTYKGHQRLGGKVAIVTGGDSGIGRAVSVAFAKEGADVCIAYHSAKEDAEEVSREIEKIGRGCLLIQCDVTKEQDCRKVVDDTIKKFGKLDCLVNNAAYQGKATKEFGELSHERVETTFKTNIISMFDLVRFAQPHMKPGSTIINVGSIQAYDPSCPILDYATTKAAIVGFTKGLAPEFIKKYGIRVNCVAPGPVWTPLVVASFDAEKVSKFGSAYPIGRPAQPVELAGAFVYLASQESSYVAGEVLGVTGGGILA